MSDKQVRIRGYSDNDRNFIIDSWVRSYAKCAIYGDKEAQDRKLFPEEADGLEPARGPRAPKTRADIYLHGQGQLIKKLLPRSRVLVACAFDDYDQVFGYIVFEEGRGEMSPVLHYVYVKAPFRGMGIAKRLFSEAHEVAGQVFRQASHWSSVMRTAAHGIEYNPYRSYI